MPADKKKVGYEEVKADKVIETISKGDEVISCDFAKMQIKSCDELTIGGLRSQMANPSVLFFKKVVTNA